MPTSTKRVNVVQAGTQVMLIREEFTMLTWCELVKVLREKDPNLAPAGDILRIDITLHGAAFYVN